MSRAQGLKAFLAALCVSAVAMDSASAQGAADVAPVEQDAAAASPSPEDGSRPGWLLRNQNRGVVNPFRATPAPGTGSARENRQPTGLLPLARSVPQAGTAGIPNARGLGAGCSIGFRQQGTACVAVQIPENGTLDLTGHGWMCHRGFQRQEQGCAAVIIPENASLDATGRRWACNYGYRRQAQGQTCIAVVVPEHASLDSAGHNWTCNQGYERRDQGCIDDATARLQQQADKAVNARPSSAPAAQRPSVSVNSGENRQGRTSKAKVIIGRF